MKLLHSISCHRKSVSEALSRRFCTASTDAYSKRNYANNVSEYNTVVNSLTSRRRQYLLRDVYDDLVLDGVQPTRDFFHSLIIGTMKGSRLQDAIFFRDQMKTSGLFPDVMVYNFLISTCGKCRHSNEAVRIFEEMKKYEVKPNGQTYVCLLNACAATGQLDRVYAIVRDMTAAGAGLNKFCYAGLITAHLNKLPIADDTTSKIMEFVERSKSWSSVETSSDNAENAMMGIAQEELYNLPTAEYVNRRGGFVARALTVYHVAFYAFAELRNVEAMETLKEMLEKDGKNPDVFILLQMMRCYLNSGDIDRGHKIFEDFMKSGRPPYIEFFVTLVEGAMTGYTSKGMQIAQDTLVQLNSKNVSLTSKMGSDLLLKAAGEKTGGYTTANYIWDLMQATRLNVSLPAVEAYYRGLKEREIPADDPRLRLVARTLNGAQRGATVTPTPIFTGTQPQSL